MTKDQLESDIWRACDILRRDNNCGGVMEYVEHLAWLLFLKFLDDQEKIFETEAVLDGRPYERILDGPYRWSDWVTKALGAPDAEGRRQTPEWSADELIKFVHADLIPHLQTLSGSPKREVISGVFSDRNVIVAASPYNLKDVLAIVDEIDFKNLDNVDTVGQVYESLLKRLGNENKMAGEFYTPRAVIRFVAEVIDPKVGETVYDPACGSCGFLTVAYDHMKEQETTQRDHAMLQRKTFFGNEKKSLPAMLGMMNMVLHGVSVPEIRRRNTLEESIKSSVSERFDVILTNPPFGGTENKQIQQNFPVKGNATELLFMQHIMKKLRPRDGARCGMVIPEGTLFRGGAFAQVKEALLQTYDLYMVVSLPPGTFAPYSDVKTALLFFEKPGPTREVLYYEMLLPEGLKKFSKGSPIQDEHFDEAQARWNAWKAYRKGEADQPERTDTSWIETYETLAERGFDLSAQNPTAPEREQLPHPSEITATLLEHSRELHSILESLHVMVSNGEEE